MAAMPSVNKCPFCNSEDRRVLENKLAYAMLSNPRLVPGHFLVIPKRHIVKPWELTQQELLAVFELVFKLQKAISRNLANGADVRQHYRPFLKQSRIKVDHVHYHVLPREFKDKLYRKVQYREAEIFEDLTDEEAERIIKLIS